MPRKGENIYKRKDGRWEIRIINFYDEKGKAHYKSYYAASYKEAKNKKEEVIRLNNPTNKSEKQYTKFETLCFQWLQSIESEIKESSYVKYKDALLIHIIPRLGNYNVEEIDTVTVETFLSDLLENGISLNKGLSSKSVSDIKSILKSIFIFAGKQHFRIKCFVEHIQVKQSKRNFRVLSCQEQTILETYLSEHDTLINFGIFLCLYSGIRIGEICALRWADINISDNTLHINKTMQRIRDYKKTSDKKTKIIITSPKSVYSIRQIPLPYFFKEKLIQKGNGMEKNAFVLTGKVSEFIEPRTMSNNFKKILQACGLTDINFHALRHTFATRCAEMNFDIKTLSNILGHANVNITLNRYVHPSMELKRQNMDKLNPLISVSNSGQ